MALRCGSRRFTSRGSCLHKLHLVLGGEGNLISHSVEDRSSVLPIQNETVSVKYVFSDVESGSIEAFLKKGHDENCIKTLESKDRLKGIN